MTTLKPSYKPSLIPAEGPDGRIAQGKWSLSDLYVSLLWNKYLPASRRIRPHGMR